MVIRRNKIHIQHNGQMVLANEEEDGYREFSIQRNLPLLKSNILLTTGTLLLGCIFLAGCSSSSSDGDSGSGTDPVIEDPGTDPIVTWQTPSRSSSVALTIDDERLLVVNKQNNSVSVLQVRDESGADSETLLGEVPVGQSPHSVAISPASDQAFVTNSKDGTVSVIDISQSTPSSAFDPIEVGFEPHGIAITPNGRYLYVANYSEGTVSVIQRSVLQVVNTVNVGGNPLAIAITNDGDDDDLDEQVYVTRFFSEVIDPGNRPDGFNDSKQGVVDYFGVESSLTTSPRAFQYTIAPLADSGFTADRRQFCAGSRNALQDAGEQVFFNSGVAATGDGAAALANDTFCPDNNSNDISADGALANVVQGVYPNYLYGALIRNNQLYIPNVGASPEPPVRFNLNVQALVSRISLSNGQNSTINLNNLIKAETQPEPENESLDRLFGNDIVAMDATSDGSTFLIVSRGGNYVLLAQANAAGELDINAAGGATRFQTGNIPSGIVISLDGTRAYTNNEVNTSVTTIDLQNNIVLERDVFSSTEPAPGSQKHRNVLGKLVFYTALGAPDQFDADGDGSFDIALKDIDPLEFRGKASDNAWSSCSSCHEEGRTDNVTWIFPTGPRQTVPLEGTFANSNPNDQRILNWNSVRGSVTDFNNNSRGVQGGRGHATDVNGIDRTGEVFNHGPADGISDALDAMTEWVANSVSAPNMPDDYDSAAFNSGRGNFQVYCASCHGGEKWTKSTTLAYQNNPTFADNPLGANFFADGRVPPLDSNLTVGGPQIRAVAAPQALTFLDDVGTHNNEGQLEIRGAGAIGGGLITIPGDANEGVEVARQSTQGFASLGGIGYNTPSLLGVATHAPYLHDGSAETLEEVFARHQLPDEDNATIDQVLPSASLLEDLKVFLLSIDDQTDPIN